MWKITQFNTWRIDLLSETLYYFLCLQIFRKGIIKRTSKDQNDRKNEERTGVLAMHEIPIHCSDYIGFTPVLNVGYDRNSLIQFLTNQLDNVIEVVSLGLRPRLRLIIFTSSLVILDIIITLFQWNCIMLDLAIHNIKLAPVVRRTYEVVHWINHYPVGNVVLLKAGLSS